MHTPRIAAFSFHPPHKSRATHPLRTRHTRYLSTHTTWKRPQPQPSYSATSPGKQRPRSGQSIFYFSTTPSLKAREPNFYETLELPPTATAQEIKKQFYILSMRHHPDRNRKDPNAHQRFTRISTAYNTLRNAQKRAVYDRDHGILTRPQQPSYPTGSHSSHSASNGSFAGSRPASGLSKRRGTFQGPPPSFYAQGGYGTTGRTGAEGSYAGGEEFTGKSTGKVEDPEDPMGFIYRNPLRHFNARAHFKTQSAEDRRRVERRRAARRAAVRDEEVVARSGGGHIDMGMLASILGILVGACCIGGLVTKLPHDSTPPGGAAGALNAAEAKRKKDKGLIAS